MEALTPPPPRWTRRWLLSLLAAAGLARGQGRPGEQVALPDQVKAAYIYNFGNFVDWPDGVFPASDSPLQIGVVEADGLAQQLAHAVAGRTVRGRSVAVRTLRPRDPTAGVQMLVIGKLAPPQLGEVLVAARGQPVLLVTEAEGALARGSMINFVMADQRLRFEIAAKTAEQSGLTISARLLAAALRVEGR
ncbi:MAG: YfiR family protein [Pseudorhodoferax sp.]